MRPNEWMAYEAAVSGALGPHRVLLCSGSLPPGAPPDGYARLVGLARERGVTAIVDAAGPAVAAALAAGRPRHPEPRGGRAALGHGDSAEPVDVPPDARPRARGGRGRAVRPRRAAAVVTAAAAGAALATGAGGRDLAAGPRGRRAQPGRHQRRAARPGSRPRSSAASPLDAARPARHGGGRRLRGGRARAAGSTRLAPAGAAGAAAVERCCSASTCGTTRARRRISTRRARRSAHGRAQTPWRRVASRRGGRAARATARRRRRGRRGRVGRGAGNAVAGVGVASMGEAGVLLDRAGEPLGPLIAWYDARGERRPRRWRPTSAPDASRPAPDCPVRPMTAPSSTAGSASHSRAGRAVRRLNVAEWIVRGLGGEEPDRGRSRRGRAGSTWPRATGGTRRSRGPAHGARCSPPIALGAPAGRAGGAIARAEERSSRSPATTTSARRSARARSGRARCSTRAGRPRR